jgi:transglutaminase-like putative cysteine protease
VAASKQGDCSEFAVLAAAMCRSVGIPTQVVVGVAYVSDIAGRQGFRAHVWMRAYMGDKWIGFDPAFKAIGLGGYGAGHIALAIGDGEPGDFFKLETTLARFKIEKLIVNRK